MYKVLVFVLILTDFIFRNRTKIPNKLGQDLDRLATFNASKANQSFDKIVGKLIIKTVYC